MYGDAGKEWFDYDFGPDWDDSRELTNYLLAQLVAARTGEDADGPGGYYDGGASTASVTPPSPAAVVEGEQRERVHYGNRQTIATDNTKDDPLKLALPFVARLFDFRDWSGELYVAYRDPTDVADDTVWQTLDGTRDDPVSEVPARTGTLWLASPTGTETKPLVDAYVDGRNS